MWKMTVAIHSVLKKKIQSLILKQLNIKKIEATKTILKISYKKTKEKTSI
jgi:hypothetical protein